MKELICIECPRSCVLQIDDNMQVCGNTCPRGKIYAQNEVTCPKRTIASTVKICSETLCRLPVISSEPLPKEKIFDVMKEINNVCVKAPVKMHDVIIKNVCGLGVDIIATRNIER